MVRSARDRHMSCAPDGPGADELWARFDAAVEQLNAAGARDSLAEIVAAYAESRSARTELAGPCALE